MNLKLCFGALLLSLGLTSCDDGDLVFESLDFDAVTPVACSTQPANEVLYKINGREALVLYVNNLQNQLPSSPTNGVPVYLPVDNQSVRFLYRLYQDTPTADNFCGSLQAVLPAVNEQWHATGGQLEVSTTARYADNTTAGFEGGERITHLRHSMVFRNLNFQTPNNVQAYSSYPFGNVDRSFAHPSLSNFSNTTFYACDEVVYAKSGTTSINLQLDDALWDNSVLNTPKIGYINANNTITFNQFASDVDLNTLDYCSLSIAPLSQWTAVLGEPGISGQIEVVTSTFGSGFQHTIKLHNVYFAQNSLQFKLADEFVLGTYVQL